MPSRDKEHPPPLSDDLRTLRNQLGGHAKWAKTTDRSAATAPARAGREARFLAEVDRQDPDHTLTERQRADLLQSIRSAHYTRMSLLAAKALRAKRQAAAAAGAAGVAAGQHREAG